MPFIYKLHFSLDFQIQTFDLDRLWYGSYRFKLANESVNEGLRVSAPFCLTPTRHIFLAISWFEEVNFKLEDDKVNFVLDQHA